MEEAEAVEVVLTLVGVAEEILLVRVVRVLPVPFVVVLAVGIEKVVAAAPVVVHNLAEEEVLPEMMMMIPEVVLERNDREMLYGAQMGIEIPVFREQAQPPIL